VSTIPAFAVKIIAEPYVMVAVIPQKWDAGEVVVRGLKQLLSVRIDHGAKATYVYPMVRAEYETPPKVSTPYTISVELMGLNEIPTTSCEMACWV